MLRQSWLYTLANKALVAYMAAQCLLLVSAHTSSAADYPTRPVRVIVAVAPGGVGDIFMRSLGERLSKQLKQSFIIENRPGGAFNIAARACAESTPDGYTICLMPGEPLTYSQFLFKDIGFNPVTAFAPITNLFFITQVFAVNASLGVNDFPALASLSKQKPGTLSYSAPALSHAQFIEEFKAKTGADIVGVPFKGGGDAMTSFITGSVPIVFLGLGNVMPFIENGKAIALLSDGEQRSPLIPNVPTVKETGYGGVELTRAYFGLLAPAKTPPQIIDALHQAIVTVFKDNEFLEKQLINRGLDPINNSPSEFADYLKFDRIIAEKVAKASGRKAE